MTVTSQTARLRAHLYRTPDGCAATRRDLALEFSRLCPRDASAWASLSRALIDLGLFSKARVALRRLKAKDETSIRISCAFVCACTTTRWAT